MSKVIQKRVLIAILFTLFIFLGSCACFDEDKGGGSYTWELSSGTTDLVEQAISDAKAERDIVKALAQAADQSKVFNNAGTTGWEAFINEVDDSIYNFEKALFQGSVYGAYSEDMEVSGSTGACMYHRDTCQSFYVINLDYKELIDPNCITHEGAHGEPDYPLHSDTLSDLISAYGPYLPVASDIWEQVIEDQDTPYDMSFFYMVTDDLYWRYMMACDSVVDHYTDRVVNGELSADEAKSEALAQNEYGAYDNDIFNCEWWLSYEVLSDIEGDYNPGLVAFDISDEELITAFCDNIAPTCEEQLDGQLNALAEAMAGAEEAEETATGEPTARSTKEITKSAATAKTTIRS